MRSSVGAGRFGSADRTSRPDTNARQTTTLAPSPTTASRAPQRPPPGMQAVRPSPDRFRGAGVCSALAALALMALARAPARADDLPSPSDAPAAETAPAAPDRPAPRDPATPTGEDEAASARRQPEARNPLGYPESIGDGPTVLPSFPKRADEPQVPGGLDPYRAPEHAHDPDGLLAWFQEPFPASPCDRNVVDPAWMGPGEYAYHKSDGRCWCTRDHTRMFRMNYMGRLWIAPELLLWSTSGNFLPALVTSSPAGTPAAQAGVIGQPGTSILFGNDWMPGTFRPGGRITVGYWLDPAQIQQMLWQPQQNPVNFHSVLGCHAPWKVLLRVVRSSTVHFPFIWVRLF